jgi:hypothetical protein
MYFYCSKNKKLKSFFIFREQKGKKINLRIIMKEIKNQRTVSCNMIKQYFLTVSFSSFCVYVSVFLFVFVYLLTLIIITKALD